MKRSSLSSVYHGRGTSYSTSDLSSVILRTTSRPVRLLSSRLWPSPSRCFGGDSLLALSLYQYGLIGSSPIVAMDVEQRKQYKWVAGQLERRHGHSNPKHPTVDSLAWWKMLKSKRPIHSAQQIAAIKKLASSAIANPAHWYQVTQFFSS